MLRLNRAVNKSFAPREEGGDEEKKRDSVVSDAFVPPVTRGYAKRPDVETPEVEKENVNTPSASLTPATEKVSELLEKLDKEEKDSE